MKKEWVRPLTMVQNFVPNEYVAACGDSGVVYNFECNAGAKNSRYNVYFENGIEYGTTGSGYYHPCGETHSAESDSGFYKGYMKEIEYGFLGTEKEVGKQIPVIIWKGQKGDDVHCTTNLDMSKWETAKS